MPKKRKRKDSNATNIRVPRMPSKGVKPGDLAGNRAKPGKRRSARGNVNPPAKPPTGYL